VTQVNARSSAMNDIPQIRPDIGRRDKPEIDPQFAAAQGERWRRFLERVGTRSNDFASRLARARFVYLHRQVNNTHWLPL
jgi:hypothetical protein